MLDVNAIHGGTAGEINALAEKAVPVNADLILIEDSAAANAKKKVQVGNLPGGGGGLGYCLFVSAPISSPVDAQTVYFSNIADALETDSARRKVYIPKAGIIKAVDVTTYAKSAAGTDEAWSAYLRLNNASDTLIATLSLATAERHFVNLALNIAVVAGDYINIKLVNPTWVTNPAGVLIGGHVYIE